MRKGICSAFGGRCRCHLSFLNIVPLCFYRIINLKITHRNKGNIRSAL